MYVQRTNNILLGITLKGKICNNIKFGFQGHIKVEVDLSEDGVVFSMCTTCTCSVHRRFDEVPFQ